MRYIFLVLIIILSAWAPLFAQPFVEGGTVAAATLGTHPVYPNGYAVFTVPASQYLNVTSSGSGNARVYQQLGGPSANGVARYSEMTGSPLSNIETVFGPFTTGTIVKVESQADFAYYSVGANGVAYPCIRPGVKQAIYMAAPVTETVSVTALSSDLINGTIVYTNAGGSTANYTLPTGTLLDAATNLQIGQAFDWSIINLSTVSGSTVTVVAGSGHTIVGDVLIQLSAQSTGCASGRFRSRKTAANTFITYRIQ